VTGVLATELHGILDRGLRRGCLPRAWSKGSPGLQLITLPEGTGTGPAALTPR